MGVYGGPYGGPGSLAGLGAPVIDPYTRSLFQTLAVATIGGAFLGMWLGSSKGTAYRRRKQQQTRTATGAAIGLALGFIFATRTPGGVAPEAIASR